MNICDIKLNALETFYSFIDEEKRQNKVADYNKAIIFALDYGYQELSTLKKIIWCFAILTRFERSALLISNYFAEIIDNLILLYNSDEIKEEISKIDINSKKALENDYKTAVAYMKWYKLQEQ